MKQENTKQRIQFDFSVEAMKRLEELKEETDVATKAEVIRNALKLYDWFVKQVEPDYIVEIKDRDDNTIFRMPASTLM